jgi:hypothetical protein
VADACLLFNGILGDKRMAERNIPQADAESLLDIDDLKVLT